jgi:hypothetical protein
MAYMRLKHIPSVRSVLIKEGTKHFIVCKIVQNIHFYVNSVPLSAKENTTGNWEQTAHS